MNGICQDGDLAYTTPEIATCRALITYYGVVKTFRRQTRQRLLTLALSLPVLIALYLRLQSHPEDFPFTALDLTRPPGLFTASKLSALGADTEACRAALEDAGFAFEIRPPQGSEACFSDALTRAIRPANGLVYMPFDVAPSCAVTAALLVWERDRLQPAAQRHFNQPVTQIDHYGSYNCRRIYGRSSGRWSEHATGNAIDIAGFRLADGRRVSVINGWQKNNEETAFLKEIRDAACEVFATVLSPDYNSAHADHLHLDQAGRGASGRKVCR